MSALPSSVGAPALPQVSLIPPEFARRSRQTRLRAISLVIVLGAVGLIVAWWFVAVGVKAVAENSLAEEQNRRAELSEELATLAYVLDARDDHDRAIAAASWAAATDVRWDAYIAQIEEAVPEGVLITSIEVAQISPVAAALSYGGGPFDEPDLGVIVISGRVADPQLSNDFIAALTPISGVYHVEISDIAYEARADSDVPSWNFTIVMDLGLEALSGRSILGDGSAQ